MHGQSIKGDLDRGANQMRRPCGDLDSYGRGINKTLKRLNKMRASRGLKRDADKRSKPDLIKALVHQSPKLVYNRMARSLSCTS